MAVALPERRNANTFDLIILDLSTFLRLMLARPA